MAKRKEPNRTLAEAPGGPPTILSSETSIAALRTWDAEMAGKIEDAAKRRSPGSVARLGLVRSEVQKQIAAQTLGQMRCA